MTGKRKSSGWSQIRQRLKTWSQPSLTGLVKDLYDASPSNRDFLQARVQGAEDGDAMLERYRGKIAEQFFPRRGFGKAKLGEARRAIRDYRKATGNIAGTIDLMLTFVEEGTNYTLQYGDIDAGYYRSLESVLDEIARLLLQEGLALYGQFDERLVHLSVRGSHLGWGYGDYLRESVEHLDEELGGRV